MFKCEECDCKSELEECKEPRLRGEFGVVLVWETTWAFVDGVAKWTWRWTKKGLEEETYDFDIEDEDWQLLEDEKSTPEI